MEDRIPRAINEILSFLINSGVTSSEVMPILFQAIFEARDQKKIDKMSKLK